MSDWIVIFEDALEAWEVRARPPSDAVLAVLSWLLEVVAAGPPDEHLPVPLEEDLYVSRIPGTSVFITYLALTYERRVVIRRIE